MPSSSQPHPRRTDSHSRRSSNASLPRSNSPALPTSTSSTKLPLGASPLSSTAPLPAASAAASAPDMAALLDLPLNLTIQPAAPGGQERVVSGHLWSYDMLSGVVVLQSSAGAAASSSTASTSTAVANGVTTSSNGAAAGSGAGAEKKSFRILKVSQIKSIQIQPGASLPSSSTATANGGPSDSFAAFSNPKGGLDVPRPLLPSWVQQREAEAIKKEEKDEVRIGRGVTRLAQELFDALAKTNNVRWHEKSIILNDDVMVSPPYTSESIKTTSDIKAEGRLERVRKVLDGERAKLFRLHPELKDEAQAGTG